MVHFACSVNDFKLSSFCVSVSVSEVRGVGVHIGSYECRVVVIEKPYDILYGKVVSSRRAVKGSYCLLFKIGMGECFLLL